MSKVTKSLKDQAERRRALQEAEYYLPIHWLLKKSGSVAYSRKSDLMASMVRSAGLRSGRVLDVGCGDGRGTYDLQTRLGAAFRCEGVDFSERAIAFARLMAPAISFGIQTVLELPFADATFDFVVAREVIEHIPQDELKGFFEQIRRVLRPDGWLLLTTPSQKRRMPEKHYQHFTTEGLKGLVHDGGFHTTQIRGFGWWPPKWCESAYRCVLDLPMLWRIHVALGTDETSLLRCDDLLLLCQNSSPETRLGAAPMFQCGARS